MIIIFEHLLTLLYVTLTLAPSSDNFVFKNFVSYKRFRFSLLTIILHIHVAENEKGGGGRNPW